MTNAWTEAASDAFTSTLGSQLSCACHMTAATSATENHSIGGCPLVATACADDPLCRLKLPGPRLCTVCDKGSSSQEQHQPCAVHSVCHPAHLATANHSPHIGVWTPTTVCTRACQLCSGSCADQRCSDTCSSQARHCLAVSPSRPGAAALTLVGV